MNGTERNNGCLSSPTPPCASHIPPDLHRPYSTSDDDSGCVMDEYAWIPSGVKPDVVHNYFSSLPPSKVPLVNSVGEQWRLKQLAVQLPPQDSDPRYCGNLSPKEVSGLLMFVQVRKKECLGKGLIKHLPLDIRHPKIYCHQCKVGINAEELIISAPERFEDRAFWHPQCFICVECKELLIDLIYYKHGENVFCGRHHAEQIKPRCASCDELIFSEECTEAEGRVWHMKHFICRDCNCQLGGQQYVIHEQRPLCLPCYHLVTRQRCNTCGKEILADKPFINQGATNWHADERCFCCSMCERSLLNRRYGFHGKNLFCGVDRCLRVFGPRFPPPPIPSPAPPHASPDGNKKSKELGNVIVASSSASSPSSPSTAGSARVRFDLRQLPRSSPPPTPLPATTQPIVAQPVRHLSSCTPPVVSSASENVYETVMSSTCTPLSPSNPSILKKRACERGGNWHPPRPLAITTSSDGVLRARKKRRPCAFRAYSATPSPSPSSSSTSLCSLDAAYCGGKEWNGGGGGALVPHNKNIVSIPPRCRSADGRRRKRTIRSCKTTKHECKSTTTGKGGATEQIMPNAGRLGAPGKDPEMMTTVKHSPQNFYSRTPLNSMDSWSRKKATVKSYLPYTKRAYPLEEMSSDSDDADDIYLTDYLAFLSLERPTMIRHNIAYAKAPPLYACAEVSKAHRPMARIASKTRTKTNESGLSNCIVT